MPKRQAGLLRLKKKASTISSHSSSTVNTHTSVYRKNKAMKELHAADDSMDELGQTTFAPGSSTELVSSKAKLISRTSKSIKKAQSVHEATQPTALSPIPEEEAHQIGPLSAAERL